MRICLGGNRRLMVVVAALSAVCVLKVYGKSSPEKSPDPLVRLAELEIDPTQLKEYKAALTEEIDASIRLEPGVLTLYAVAVKGHPAQIRLFECYRDEASYQAHLRSPHFRKYKAHTRDMVKSLNLIETEPVLLRSKVP